MPTKETLLKESLKLEFKRTIDDVRSAKMIYYAANTCWWGTEVQNSLPNGLPSDPIGSVLFMTDESRSTSLLINFEPTLGLVLGF